MKQLIYKNTPHVDVATSLNNLGAAYQANKQYDEAIKYNSKFLFRKNSNGAYLASKSKGWFEEVCEHMKKNIL